MKLLGLKAVKDYREQRHADNLTLWYARHPEAGQRYEGDDLENSYPYEVEYSVGLSYTPRQRAEYHARMAREDADRREREARQHCNPGWGHTYGCDGSCNYGIDYDTSGFGTY